MDGNSYYFFRLTDSDVFYAVSASDSPLAVILNVGDQVTITYTEGANSSILAGSQIHRASGEDGEITLPLPEEEPETGDTAPTGEGTAEEAA